MGKVTEYHGTIKPMGNDKNNISAIIEKKKCPFAKYNKQSIIPSHENHQLSQAKFQRLQPQYLGAKATLLLPKDTMLIA